MKSMNIALCYDLEGDVTFSQVVCMAEEVITLKNHECVFIAIDVDSGEVLFSKTEEFVRWPNMSNINMVDWFYIMDLKWVDV